MYFKLVNLTSLFVIKKIEEVLVTYSEYPYQVMFSISYWKQMLIAYILSRVPNRYIVIEAPEAGSNVQWSKMWQFTVEEQLSIENVIKTGIISLLRENPNWKDKEFFSQDLSMDVLNLEILSLNCRNSIPTILSDGQICLTLEKKQLDYNVVSIHPVPITDPQHIIIECDCYCGPKIRELELRNRELSLLNDLNDCLQMCQTKISIYQALNKLVPFLFPETLGGLFQINLLNYCVESLAIWGQFLDSQRSLMAQDFWALHQGYLHGKSNDEFSLLSTYIHRQPNAGDSLGISLMSQSNMLDCFYIINEHPRSLTPAQQQLVQQVVKKTVLTLSRLILQENLQEQALRDPLTNLFNRRYLEENLPREIERASRTQSSIGLVMIDVDHFKKINDIFGHNFGDLALQVLAKFFQENIREKDIVCRYGGEEFIIIFSNTSLEKAHARAEKIRHKVKFLTVSDGELCQRTMTISLGVACFPEHGTTSSSLILSADRALYQAKQQGRNRTVLAHSCVA